MMETELSVDTPRAATRIGALNREAILEAALAAFSVHGFRGTTIDEIAARAGMSKPNLLYYFPRKTAVYRAVLERTLELWLAPLEALDPSGDPVEELRRYITAKLRMSHEAPDASRLFANEILAGAPVVRPLLETQLRRLVQEKAGVIRTWVDERRLAPVDPVHLIFLIWAATQHYADFASQIRAILGTQMDQPGFREQAAQAVLTIVLRGVQPRGDEA